MVQKSGYFSRSAPANQRDLDLIRSMTDLAVDCALNGEPGVIGHDEEKGDELRAIEFSRIKGGKPFDINQPWFTDLLAGIGQPATEAAAESLTVRDPQRRAAADQRRHERDQRSEADAGGGAGDVAGPGADAERPDRNLLGHHDRFLGSSGCSAGGARRTGSSRPASSNAGFSAVAIQAAMNKINVAKKLKNNINTMIGPKKRAARLLAKMPDQEAGQVLQDRQPDGSHQGAPAHDPPRFAALGQHQVDVGEREPAGADREDHRDQGEDDRQRRVAAAVPASR